MAEKEKTIEITSEMIDYINKLMGNQDEVNLEWIKAVTQLPTAVISRIIIQNLGLVVLEGMIYSKEKAERKLKQMQEDAQAEVDRETFRKGPVRIDMMKLREMLWTIMLNERIAGQTRHQFCPIWIFLEQDSSTSIILRYDWITRLDSLIKNNDFNNLRIINAESIINELGENYRNKSRIIFAKTIPRDSVFDRNKSIWISFLVSITENGVRLEGLNMLNVLSLSSRFRSREKAYAALNVYIELVNYLVSDPSIFEEVIIAY
ncbi:MAG: hypothetical protein FK734_01240 [Asgard group archaeon]|nr:hypothetical protein [Asgard group archaeon]